MEKTFLSRLDCFSILFSTESELNIFVDGNPSPKIPYINSVLIKVLLFKVLFL